MKNIIIAGSGRAGKTTLARKIGEELGCFVINLDKLIATFGGAYPQLDIRLAWDREKAADNIAPFLGHFLGMFSGSQGVAHELHLRTHTVKGNRFVLEGGHFNFEKISAILRLYGIQELRDQFLLIGLVQNQKTPEQFFSDLRKYDTEDEWTYTFDDDELQACIAQDFIPSSLSMTGYLRKHGFAIYDTSVRREQILAQIIEDIKSKR